jgi:hypothetical protein
MPQLHEHGSAVPPTTFFLLAVNTRELGTATLPAATRTARGDCFGVVARTLGPHLGIRTKSYRDSGRVHQHKSPFVRHGNDTAPARATASARAWASPTGTSLSFALFSFVLTTCL